MCLSPDNGGFLQFAFCKDGLYSVSPYLVQTSSIAGFELSGPLLRGIIGKELHREGHMHPRYCVVHACISHREPSRTALHMRAQSGCLDEHANVTVYMSAFSASHLPPDGDTFHQRVQI